MSATKLTGAMRPDGLIELTGTAAQFRTVLRQAGVRLATLDLPGQEAEEDARPLSGLLPLHPHNGCVIFLHLYTP